MVAKIPQIKSMLVNVKSQGIMRIIAQGEKDKSITIKAYFFYPL